MLAVARGLHARRWIVRAGAPWRLLPTNFPPWPTVYQQARRWVEAGCSEALVHDLRLPTVLAGLHFIAFACLLLQQVIPLISRS